MKANLLLIFAAILLWLLPVDASAQHIKYSIAIPNQVVLMLPRDTVPCFYGKFRLAGSGRNYAVILSRPGDNAVVSASDSDKTYHFQLSVLEHNAHRKWHLLNRIDTTYTTSWGPLENDAMRFGIDQIWLDEKHRRVPILKINCFDPQGGYGGASGDYLLIYFRDGFAGNAHLRQFSYGSVKASDFAGCDVTFDEVDERGYLQIHTFIRYPHPEQNYEEIWRWHDEFFEKAITIRHATGVTH